MFINYNPRCLTVVNSIIQIVIKTNIIFARSIRRLSDRRGFKSKYFNVFIKRQANMHSHPQLKLKLGWGHKLLAPYL